MSKRSRRQARHGVVILVFLVTLLNTASAAVGADTTRPSTPRGLTATAIYSTQVTLSWTASTDNVGVAGYNVRRNDVIVGTSSTTSFTDTGLTPKIRYKYRVQAFDAAGNVSAFSSRISVRTNTTAPPSTGTNGPTAPTGLTASAASSSQVKLAWSAATDNVSVVGYRVFRNGGMVNTTANLSYMDTGLAASTAYTYTVQAFDVAGYLSQTSNTASATTLAAPPAADTSPPTAPTGLSASAASSSQINLLWSASSDNVGVAGYAIFRNGSQIATTGSLSYNNTGLAASTTYTYNVKAYDAAGNVSAASASASATTQATPPPTSGSFWIAPTGNDSNPGTQAAPWRTIQKAANTLTAGQTAIVMDGTYEEGQILFQRSGTATQPITLKAANQQQAILSSTSGCSESMGIYASYITIDGLRLQVSPNEPMPSGCSTANYFIHAWELTNPSVSNPSSGYVGFTLRNARIDFSTHRNGSFKTRQDFSLIEDNVLSDGSECFNNNGCILRNNTVNGPPRDWIPILIGKGGVRNMQIYNNVIHIVTSNNSGVVLGETTGTPYMFDGTYEGFNAVAYNNVVINNSGSVNPVAALGMVACKDCVMMNNVAIGGQLFVRLDGSGSPGLSSQNPTFKNNIVTCGNGSATGPWDYTGTLTVDYNDFYQCTGVPFQAHAIVGDPKFVNSTSDWHLQAGSPALGSGVEVNMFGYNGEVIDVSRNWDGDVRTVPWNLGIY